MINNKEILTKRMKMDRGFNIGVAFFKLDDESSIQEMSKMCVTRFPFTSIEHLWCFMKLRLRSKRLTHIKTEEEIKLGMQYCTWDSSKSNDNDAFILKTVIDKVCFNNILYKGDYVNLAITYAVLEHGKLLPFDYRYFNPEPIGDKKISMEILTRFNIEPDEDVIHDFDEFSPHFIANPPYYIIDESALGKGLINEPGAISTARKIMMQNNMKLIEQPLQVLKPEIPMILNGYENKEKSEFDVLEYTNNSNDQEFIAMLTEMAKNSLGVPEEILKYTLNNKSTIAMQMHDKDKADKITKDGCELIKHTISEFEGAFICDPLINEIDEETRKRVNKASSKIFDNIETDELLKSFADTSAGRKAQILDTVCNAYNAISKSDTKTYYVDDSNKGNVKICYDPETESDDIIISKSHAEKLSHPLVEPVRINIDRITSRYGNKGVVSVIDETRIPVTNNGEHVEVLINPASMIHRLTKEQRSEMIIRSLQDKIIRDGIEGCPNHEGFQKIIDKDTISVDFELKEAFYKFTKREYNRHLLYMKRRKLGRIK